MFSKLYGRERDIVMAIYDKSDGAAEGYLREKYEGSQGLQDNIGKELNALKQKGYIAFIWNIFCEIHALKLLPDCRNYPEMELEYMHNQNKGGEVVFKRLFGKRREIVGAIYDKSTTEAEKYLNDLLEVEGSQEPVSSALEELIRDNFLQIGYSEDKIYKLQILSNCRDYFEMENEYDRQTQVGYGLYAPNNNGNIIAGDATNVSQSVNIGTIEKRILELVSGMKELTETLDINNESKDSIRNDLESLNEQIKSPKPKIYRLTT